MIHVWVFPVPFSFPPWINITRGTRGTNKKSDTQICTSVIFLLFGMSCTFQSNLTRYVIMLSGSSQNLYLRYPPWFSEVAYIQSALKRFFVAFEKFRLYTEGNDSIFAWSVCHCWCQVNKILAWIVSVQINVNNELINIRKWCVRLVIIGSIEYDYHKGGVECDVGGRD